MYLKSCHFSTIAGRLEQDLMEALESDVDPRSRRAIQGLANHFNQDGLSAPPPPESCHWLFGHRLVDVAASLHNLAGCRAENPEKIQVETAGALVKCFPASSSFLIISPFLKCNFFFRNWRIGVLSSEMLSAICKRCLQCQL